jgi:hypothetical protein
MFHVDSALPTGESTYYTFPADNSNRFAYTIATTTGFVWVSLHRLVYPLMVACNYPQKKRPKVVASSSPNEPVVDPRGADNLSQDPQTIDLTPCLRVHAY